MRALVVYESMYGNTRQIAEAVGEGLAAGGAEVTVLPLGDAGEEQLREVELLVVGGPTHAHGMSRPSTRSAARDAAEADPELHLEPDASGEGVREWIAALARPGLEAAAFDTRVGVPASISGRASKGIAKQLRRHGCWLVAEPQSFLVTKHNELEPHEREHAVEWGGRLAPATSRT